VLDAAEQPLAWKPSRSWAVFAIPALERLKMSFLRSLPFVPMNWEFGKPSGRKPVYLP
jgi:hypothetical protein